MVAEAAVAKVRAERTPDSFMMMVDLWLRGGDGVVSVVKAVELEDESVGVLMRMMIQKTEPY